MVKPGHDGRALCARPSLLRWRPLVYFRQAAAHQLCLVTVRQTIGHAERIDGWLVVDDGLRARPVGAPHAAVEAEGVEHARQRIPDILVREWLVRQRAGARDLDADVLVRGEFQHCWQFGPRLLRRRRYARLGEAEV